MIIIYLICIKVFKCEKIEITFEKKMDSFIFKIFEKEFRYMYIPDEI